MHSVQRGKPLADAQSRQEPPSVPGRRRPSEPWTAAIARVRGSAGPASAVRISFEELKAKFRTGREGGDADRASTGGRRPLV